MFGEAIFQFVQKDLSLCAIVFAWLFGEAGEVFVLIQCCLEDTIVEVN